MLIRTDIEPGRLLMSEQRIIVGIDFGTTYSGVAWAETQRPDRRVAVNSWPISTSAREGESSDKVPTKLRYTKCGDVQWGFAIPDTAPQDEVIEWFKLCALTCPRSMRSCILTSEKGTWILRWSRSAKMLRLVWDVGASAQTESSPTTCLP